MKEYKIDYVEKVTVYEYRTAWITAENEEEALNKLHHFDYLDTEFYDSEYGDDSKIFDIGTIEIVDDDYKK